MLRGSPGLDEGLPRGSRSRFKALLKGTIRVPLKIHKGSSKGSYKGSFKGPIRVLLKGPIRVFRLRLRVAPSVASGASQRIAGFLGNPYAISYLLHGSCRGQRKITSKGTVERRGPSESSP